MFIKYKRLLESMVWGGSFESKLFNWTMAWRHFVFLASKFLVRSIFVPWLKASSFSKLVFSNMRIVRREIFSKDLIQGWTVHLPEIGIAIGEHPINAKTKKILTPQRQTKEYQQPMSTTWNKPKSVLWRGSFETRMSNWINRSILCLKYQTRVLTKEEISTPNWNRVR